MRTGRTEPVTLTSREVAALRGILIALDQLPQERAACLQRMEEDGLYDAQDAVQSLRVALVM